MVNVVKVNEKLVASFLLVYVNRMCYHENHKQKFKSFIFLFLNSVWVFNREDLSLVDF